MEGNRVGTERGQSVVLVAVAIGFAAIVALGLARLGSAAMDRASAQSAADASALAGAAEGRAAADGVAAANYATLIEYRVVGTEVLVTVRVRGAQATARARADRGWRRRGDQRTPAGRSMFTLRGPQTDPFI